MSEIFDYSPDFDYIFTLKEVDELLDNFKDIILPRYYCAQCGVEVLDGFIIKRTIPYVGVEHIFCCSCSSGFKTIPETLKHVSLKRFIANQHEMFLSEPKIPMIYTWGYNSSIDMEDLT